MSPEDQRITKVLKGVPVHTCRCGTRVVRAGLYLADGGTRNTYWEVIGDREHEHPIPEREVPAHQRFVPGSAYDPWDDLADGPTDWDETETDEDET